MNANALRWTVPVVLFLAAAVAGLAGWLDGALIGVGLGMAAIVVLALMARRTSGARVVLEPNESVEIREEREERGETAAVRLVRRRYPDLSLGDAVKLVRST